jgi:DNA-directed RNA polymerase specialized sigma24 family protein
MSGEQLVVPAPAVSSQTVTDFTAWVADHHRPLLDFARLVAGDASTGEDLLQIASARAYLKWSKISARGEHPLGYVRRIIVNENASLWRRAWK